MKNKELLKRHTFCLNPHDNGGESLLITTEFLSNGDNITEKDGVFGTQSISMHSYCNSAQINLGSMLLNPKTLRELANQLESERNKLNNKL